MMKLILDFPDGGCRDLRYPGTKTPDEYYNIERMLKSWIRKGAQIKACGICAYARGLRELTLIEGVELSTMSQLAQWTAGADKVLIF